LLTFSLPISSSPRASTAPPQVAGTLLYIQSRAPPATADEEAPINVTAKSLNTHAAASNDRL
jgi:hypothetical protein